MAVGDYGVTSAGFVLKPSEVVQAEIEDEFRAAWGDDIDLSPQSDLGQAVGIATKLVHEGGWQAAQDAFAANDPDAATGVVLDKVAALTGTFRDPATHTSVYALCCGTPGTVIPVTAGASVDTTHDRFDTFFTTPATIAAISAWATGIHRLLGARIAVGGGILSCSVPGVSGSTTPALPSDIGGTVTDGTAVWTRVGTGTGAVLVGFKASTAGPIVLTAGHLTRIETPVAGWLSVFNTIDEHITQGVAIETDASLRVKRYRELHAQGRRTLLSIQSALLQVLDVTDAFVLENVEPTTDSYGIPAHSIQAIIVGGTDLDVATSLLANKGEGTQTFGTTAVTITDSKKIDHNISFSRPSDNNIYVTVDVAIGVEYPSDGDARIIDALLVYAAGEYIPASSVIASTLDRQCWLPGVTDVSCLIGTSPSPSSRTAITSTVLQIPRLDAGRISINHV
jgi:uncharacterized phage protein gp47/JayE